MDITYKRAPGRLGGHIRIQYDAEGVSTLTRDGELKRRILFRDVVSARLSTFGSMGVMNLDLVLTTPSGTVRVPHTLSGRNGHMTDDFQRFAQTVVAILRGLAAQRPELELRLAPNAGLRWFSFVIGGFLCVASALILLAVFTGEARVDKLVISAACAAAALRSGWLTPPWRSAKREAPAQAADRWEASFLRAQDLDQPGGDDAAAASAT